MTSWRGCLNLKPGERSNRNAKYWELDNLRHSTTISRNTCFLRILSCTRWRCPLRIRRERIVRMHWFQSPEEVLGLRYLFLWWRHRDTQRQWRHFPLMIESHFRDIHIWARQPARSRTAHYQPPMRAANRTAGPETDCYPWLHKVLPNSCRHYSTFPGNRTQISRYALSHQSTLGYKRKFVSPKMNNPEKYKRKKK